MAVEQLNPGTKARPDGQRKRIPMSVPVQRLEAAEIPGYHLHWFKGDLSRIQRALEGGYEYVAPREMHVNSVGLGNDSVASGNTDMGSRVSIVSGTEIGTDGQPVRLVLMKIKQEWYEEDQKIVDDRNELVAASLRGGLFGSERDAPGDSATRYVDKNRTVIPDLFKPKRPRGV